MAAARALLVAYAVAGLYTIPSVPYAVVMVWTWDSVRTGKKLAMFRACSRTQATHPF